MGGRRKPREACPRDCFRFDELPVGSYFMRCGKITEARRARGEPVSGYKKVNEHGSVEMLLKDRGWGPAKRLGGKSAPYYPVRDNPCIRQLGRDWAVRYAEGRAKFVTPKTARRRKVA
jgi:hypothetical protein